MTTSDGWGDWQEAKALEETDPDLYLNASITYWPRQSEAREFMCPLDDWAAGVDEMLYGGQAGGGKSAYACRIAVEYALAHHGTTVWLFRRTEPVAKNTFLPRLRPIIPLDEDGNPIAKYNVDELTFTFAEEYGGSKIRLCYLDKEVHLANYFSDEAQLIIFDEAVQFEPGWVDLIVNSRLRSTTGAPCKVLYCTNPGGPLHSYLFDRFIDGHEPMVVHSEHQSYTDEDTGQTWSRDLKRVFVPSKVTDNPSILLNDPGYLIRLNQIEDEDTHRRLAKGDWYINSGQAFRMLLPEKHYCDPFRIPEHWRVWRGLDFGYEDPLACCWLAQDPDTRRIYVFDELEERELSTATAKRLICQKTGTLHATATYADTSGKARSNSTAKTVWEEFGEKPHRVPLTPAIKSRESGWIAIKSALAALDDGLPGLMFFRNCPLIFNALRSLQKDPKTAEDVIDKPGTNDHLPDALRYALRSYAYQPQRWETSNQQDNRPFDPFADTMPRHLRKPKLNRRAIPGVDNLVRIT